MRLTIFKSLAAIATLSLILSSCDEDSVKCPPGESNEILLTIEDTNKVPYSGKDTLYFLDNDGDTHIVVGQGKKIAYDKESIFHHPECPNNRFNNYQKYTINYLPITGDLYFNITQRKQAPYLLVSVKSYPIEFLGEYLSLEMKNDYYFDSLVVANSTYHSVRRFLPRIKPTTALDETYFLYYNVIHGILKIKNEQEEYSLIRKK